MVSGACSTSSPTAPYRQDRWEEDGGYSPFTLAVEIAALLAAADLAERIRGAGRPPTCARPRTSGTA
jgi:GH15 family glucan-1,4-alpha-glucosidase